MVAGASLNFRSCLKLIKMNVIHLVHNPFCRLCVGMIKGCQMYYITWDIWGYFYSTQSNLQDLIQRDKKG